MHSMHLRLPKNFVLEERLERYGRAIEAAPQAYRGRWLEACSPLVDGAEVTDGAADDDSSAPRLRELRLDLGCGKGAFLAEAARREPEVLFVGIDSEPICVAYAAQAVCEAGVDNAVVVPGDAARLAEYFAPGEVVRIHLNFPTPHPKRRHAHLRLVQVESLVGLRQVLAPSGDLILKTDSGPQFAYAQTQLPLAGYEIAWTSTDMRTDHPGEPETGYERRLTAKGATVYGIRATPTAEPLSLTDRAAAQEAIPQSLVDYLPDDLASMGYVPHGMEATVANLANLQAKGRPRALATNHD